MARSEHASDALYLKADVLLRLVEVLVEDAFLVPVSFARNEETFVLFHQP